MCLECFRKLRLVMTAQLAVVDLESALSRQGQLPSTIRLKKNQDKTNLPGGFECAVEHLVETERILVD